MSAAPDRSASDPSPDEADVRLWLSALADGEEVAPGTAERGCAAWRAGAEARATWHTYHLIGDVLRSDELAADPSRDAAFLAGLRERLAAEPVPLAPAPVSARSPAAALARGLRRHGWASSAAIAAGFVAVAGVLVVVRSGPVPGEAVPVAAGGGSTMLRDASLDLYLQAHRGALGAPVATPGGAMRHAEVIVPLPTPLPLRPASAASSAR